MNTKSTTYALLLCILPVIAGPAIAETAYVSDELKVALRSGDTRQHRIVQFITSGAKLDVVETNDAGTYKKVVTASGKEGWVAVENLMSSASARSRMPGLNQRIASLKSDIKQQKNTISELNATIKDLQNQNKKLDSYGQNKNKELEDLAKATARPALLAKQNQKLTIDLEKTNRELDLALAENASLGDSNIKEWFMIGAGVSLISLFFGLIIPNFKWRRKTDSWGGGF